MYRIAVIVAFGFAAVPASAQTSCDQISDGAWSCSLPEKPAVAPTCHVYGQNLICTAPVEVPVVDPKRKPINCGWNKAGKYVCW